jgi:hypothetical protein
VAFATVELSGAGVAEGISEELEVVGEAVAFVASTVVFDGNV